MYTEDTYTKEYRGTNCLDKKIGNLNVQQKLKKETKSSNRIKFPRNNETTEVTFL
jgi:hypothetical protein